MRILVIGGTSLTDPYSVRSLVGKGHQVKVFSFGLYSLRGGH